MTLLVDYSFAHPDPASIKAAGYDGVMRYLSNDVSKNLSATERNMLHKAGLGIGLVWETTSGRAGQGFSAGVADAQAAAAQAYALTYPTDCPIFYAVDYDANPASVLEYFRGVAYVGHRPVGVYGSARVVEAVLASGHAAYAWQSEAWSGTYVSPQAHLYQRIKATVAHPVPGTDENVVLKSFPQWAAVTAPRPPASDIPHLPPVKPPVTPPKGLVVQTIDLRNALNSPVRGANIYPLQRLLGVTADGIAGPATRHALGAAQIRIFHTADFIFGPNTASALLAGK